MMSISYGTLRCCGERLLDEVLLLSIKTALHPPSEPHAAPAGLDIQSPTAAAPSRPPTASVLGATAISAFGDACASESRGSRLHYPRQPTSLPDVPSASPGEGGQCYDNPTPSTVAAGHAAGRAAGVLGYTTGHTSSYGPPLAHRCLRPYPLPPAHACVCACVRASVRT